MSRELDDQGNLVIENLTGSDIAEILSEITDYLNEQYAAWEEQYGAIEELRLSEMGQDAITEKLDSTTDDYIWADIDYSSGTEITPVQGLKLTVNGWAIVPGRDNFRGEGEDFFISEKSWNESGSVSPYDLSPVFKYINCVCPFCDGEGEFQSDECPGCEGEGSLEIDW